VQPPAMYEPMLATPEMADELTGVLAEAGVVVGNLAVFKLNSDDPIDAYEPALAFGAGLGARTATAIDFGEPRPDIAERLAAFAALCASVGIQPLVEPISMGNVRTPQEGLALIDAAGVDARLVLDCVHLVRTGCTADTLRQLPASRIGYFQMCDGPASLTEEEIGVEAMADRLYPGEGVFPIAELLGAIPAEVTVGLEVPNLARQQAGVSAADRAGEALRAARAVVAQTGRGES